MLMTYETLIPLFEKDGYIICFEAEPEEVDPRAHFIDECGWTEERLKEVNGMYWFTAKVTAWQGGVERGRAYLSCCCYQLMEEFFAASPANPYFAEMVTEVLMEAEATGQRVGDTDCLIPPRFLNTL